MLASLSNKDSICLCLNDVRVGYGNLVAVDGVSLEVEAGKTLGLVGESGCGKTSLAKAISGVVAPESGHIEIDGTTLSALRKEPRAVIAQTVQLLHQDAVAALSPRMKIKDLLAEPLKIVGRYDSVSWGRTLQTLEIIGLGPQILDRYPHQISGGQAKRIALLRAIVLDPRVLVADEPTAGLDLSVQGEILNLLMRLQKRLGLTYVLVSHNLNVVGRVADQVAVMYLGRIIENGSTSRVFSSAAHPYTAALMSANPTLNAHRRRERIVLKGELPSPLHPPSGCRFHTRCPMVQQRCKTEDPMPRAVGSGHFVACHFPISHS